MPSSRVIILISVHLSRKAFGLGIEVGHIACASGLLSNTPLLFQVLIMYGLAILVLAVFSALYWVAFSFYTNRRHAQKAAEWGCKPLKRRQHRLPLGIDLVREMMAADKAQILPNHLLGIHAKMGTQSWVQNLMGSETIITNEPENLKALLATQFTDFEIGEQRRGNFFPMFGNGIFTSDGKAWEHSRAMLRPQFARDQVADLEVEEHHVQDLMQHLPTGGSGWTSKVNLGPIFFRLTLDSATEFLFGESVQSQPAALPSYIRSEKNKLDWTSFAPAFDGGTHALGNRSRFGDMYWLHNPKSFQDDCKTVHEFADYYVNLALNPHQRTEKDIESGKKEKYIFLQELVKVTRDPTELRSQLLNILLAGRDTTAGLLGWTFYSLVRNPDVFNKLRAEIIDRYGTFRQPHDITFASLKACAYLQYVMSETLRLYPTVPFNQRRATKDTTLPLGGGPDEKSPIYISKGTEVNYAVHIMHHRADIWGPDVEEFKPERWIGRKAGWEFLPFNGGPRICLGQQHALTLAGFTIVRMLQRFDKLENLDFDPVPKHQYTVTTAPAKVDIRLHEAKE